MDLKGTIDQLQYFEKVASTELDAVPLRNRPGWAIAKRSAGAEIQKLVEQYKEHLRTAVCGVFLAGDEAAQAQFAKTAGELGAIVVNGAEMYERVARVADSTFPPDQDPRTRRFSVNQQDHFIAGLKQVMIDLNVIEMDMPKFGEVIITPTFASVLAECRRIIQSKLAHSLLALYLKKQVVDSCVKVKESQESFPVVVYGLTEEERDALGSDFFGSTCETLSIDQAFDPDLVAAALKESAAGWRSLRDPTPQADSEPAASASEDPEAREKTSKRKTRKIDQK